MDAAPARPIGTWQNSGQKYNQQYIGTENVGYNNKMLKHANISIFACIEITVISLFLGRFYLIKRQIDDNYFYFCLVCTVL